MPFDDFNIFDVMFFGMLGLVVLASGVAALTGWLMVRLAERAGRKKPE